MTMTHPLIITAPYSTKNFAIETFTNCPETAKFAKLFTRERFSLCGTIITHCSNACTYCTRGVIKESDPENIKFRMMVQVFVHVSACNAQTFGLNIGDPAPIPHEISSPQVCDTNRRMRIWISWILIRRTLCSHSRSETPLSYFCVCPWRPFMDMHEKEILAHTIVGVEIILTLGWGWTLVDMVLIPVTTM